MHKLLNVALLTSCVTVVAALPAPSQAEVYAIATTTSPGSEPTFTVAKRRRTLNCNQDERLKKIVAQAWADAGAMAEIADQYDSGNQWQPAMDYWMGVDSTKAENFFKIIGTFWLSRSITFRSNTINTNNQKKIHHPNSLFPEAVVDMYCGDTHPTRKNLCRLQENPRNREGPLVTAFALSWVARGTFYNTYNMVLCPRFFQEKNSLESILHDMNDGKKSASNASEYKFSWGHTIYHELMHLDPVIAAEEVWDATYGACTVAKLANVNGCSNSQAPWIPPGWKSERGDPHTLINADSWAFFASGAYFQKAANLSESGRPINDCGIYTGKNLANFTYPGTEYGPEGILLSTEDAPPDIMNLQVPPDPAPENTPPDDPSTPALPYKLSSLPNGLATPFNAEEYFATYVPAASSSVPPPASTTAPSASPPAYATGTCAFHLTETQSCEGDPKNLYAIVKLVDANKADIGDTPVNNDPFGAPINAADPYSFDSKLPHPIVIVGEHQHDYVQFKYGELFWQSKTPNGGAECNNGGWDPKEGPNCSPRFGNQPAVNNIDCSFPC